MRKNALGDYKYSTEGCEKKKKKDKAIRNKWSDFKEIQGKRWREHRVIEINKLK